LLVVFYLIINYPLYLLIIVTGIKMRTRAFGYNPRRVLYHSIL